MDKVEKELDKNYKYPEQNDKHIQSKIFKKKEYYNYRIKYKPEINDYNDLKEYRDAKCGAMKIQFANHQIMLGNLMNPETPYEGLLLFHGLGTGKTAAAISIAERFVDQIRRYNTKIYILVPGPVLKENWKRELVKWVGNRYKPVVKGSFMTEEDKEKEEQMTLQNILEVYKIMSYKSFHKRVMGEKVRNKEEGSKYIKNEEGEIERIESINKINNLDNTLLIIDEAHNLTGNEESEAVRIIKKKSKNLKILILTGTPMKNAAADIVDLINMIKPSDKTLKKREIFETSETKAEETFRPGGEEYLRENIRGYVSYIKGEDEYVFGTREDIGEIPDSLKFTKIYPCEMSKLQTALYKEKTKIDKSTIEKHTSNITNFVYPLYDIENDKIVPCQCGDRNLVLARLSSNKTKYNEALSKYLKLKETNNNLIKLSKDGKTITGDFLNVKYIKEFSTKYYEIITNLNKLVYGDKGAQLAFIYSNYAQYGINIFKQALIQNGYIEFNETIEKTAASIKDDTKCYYCGVEYKNHKDKQITRKSNNIEVKIPQHEFYPAVFLTITGGSEEESQDEQDKQRKLLDHVFNMLDNYEGKYIKFVLGSKVLSEGFSLNNIGEIHIIDIWYNFSKLDQVIGRGIRKCSHVRKATELNPYPKVQVYKYCVVNKGGPSTDEILYQNAEKKQIIVKKIERIMKEEAIDCGLNMGENNNEKQIEEYKDCQEINDYETAKIDKNKQICPANCEYRKCEYKCSDKKLDKYYDKKKHIYDKVPNNELDNTTYDITLLKNEIEKCKTIIKNMYLMKYIYTLDEIVEFVREKYIKENNPEVYDIFFIYKALDELIPNTENEMNNFVDYIIDKYNRPGYLIYVNGYYIYQGLDQNKNISMYYRETYNVKLQNNVKLYDYLLYNNKMITYKEEKEEKEYKIKYDEEYYESKEENDIVGCIDINKKGEIIFKVREKMKKSDKKRDKNLQTFTGRVATTYEYNILMKYMRKLGIKTSEKLKREEISNRLMEKLLELEKYSKDKKVYCIVPVNIHSVNKKYDFPYNLKDRVEYIKNNIEETTKGNITIIVDKKKEKDTVKYELTVKGNISDYMKNKYNLEGKGNIYKTTIA